MRFSPGDILFDKYRIERLLGKGGFAEVYLATHLILNAPRALKILVRGGDITSGVISRVARRFHLEARLGAYFAREPHLVRVYDFEQDTERGLLVLVMEHLPGGSLKDRIRQARSQGQPGLSVDFVIRTAYQVALGLDALHQKRLVHRDIKPSNILYDVQGNAKIADLGVVQIAHGLTRRTELGSLAPRHPGTPEYMSPEQAHTLDYLPPASDIYSLGATLFEALTLEKYKHLRPGTRASYFRRDIPPWLDDLLLRMLSKEPEERPWNGEELARLLAPHAGIPSEAVHALDETVDEITTSPVRLRGKASRSVKSSHAVEAHSGESKPSGARKGRRPSEMKAKLSRSHWLWVLGGIGSVLFLLMLVQGAAALAGKGEWLINFRASATPAMISTPVPTSLSNLPDGSTSVPGMVLPYTLTPTLMPVATITSTSTLTPSPTSTPTLVPTYAPIPPPTNTYMPWPTNTPLPRPTRTPIPRPTNTFTPRPVVSITPSMTPTCTPSPLPPTPTHVSPPTPTFTPTLTPTLVPTLTPTPVPTPTPTPTPQPTVCLDC